MLGIEIDHPAVVARKNKVVKTLTGGIASMLKGAKVEWVKAAGVIKGKGPDGCEVEADGKVYAAKRLLIATGSEAAMPPIDGLREQYEKGLPSQTVRYWILKRYRRSWLSSAAGSSASKWRVISIRRAAK